MASTYQDKEVVIADNGSADDSIEFLKTHYPSIRVIRLEKNHGFAKGYNIALKQVDAKYYVLLNSDVEVRPGWLEPLVAMMENIPSLSACQPKILSYHHPELFEYAGGAGGWIDAYGYPFARGRIFDICEKDQGQYDAPSKVFWASGAAMFVRSTVFHEMKGFDEYFFAHQEEIDLCWRMQLAGYHLMSCPSSVVYHIGGGTLPRGNSLKTYLNFRNNLVMLAKNLPGSQRWWKIPSRIFLDAVSATKGLFTGDAGYFVAIFRAHLAFGKWLLSGKKQNIFPVRKNKILEGVYPHNLVWQHFVRKRKTFSEIIKKGM